MQLYLLIIMIYIIASFCEVRSQTVLPEATFCESQFQISLPDPKITYRGIIYSQSYPQSRRIRHDCTIRITGLPDLSWIKFKHRKISPFNGMCLRNDFRIPAYNRNIAMNFPERSVDGDGNSYVDDCGELEGTYSSSEILLRIDQGPDLISAFTIEYEIYPAFVMNSIIHTQPAFVDTTLYPEAYVVAYPMGNFVDNQTTTPFTTSPLSISLSHHLHNFPAQSIYLSFKFVRFNMGTSTDCNTDSGNRIILSTRPTPYTFYYQCYGRGNPPAPLVVPRNSKDYEIVTNLYKPPDNRTFSLAYKYRVNKECSVVGLKEGLILNKVGNTLLYKATCEEGYELHNTLQSYSASYYRCEEESWKPEQPRCTKSTDGGATQPPGETPTSQNTTVIGLISAVVLLIVLIALVIIKFRYRNLLSFLNIRQGRVEDPTHTMNVATVESAHGNGVFVWDEERYQPASGRQIADTSFSTTHHTACRVSSSSRTARQHTDTPCDLSPPSLHVDVQTYREDDETDYHQINNSETLSMRGAESVETASVEAESVEAAPEEAASVDAVAEDEVYGNHESADAESIISVYTLD